MSRPRRPVRIRSIMLAIAVIATSLGLLRWLLTFGAEFVAYTCAATGGIILGSWPFALAYWFRRRD